MAKKRELRLYWVELENGQRVICHALPSENTARAVEIALGGDYNRGFRILAEEEIDIPHFGILEPLVQRAIHKVSNPRSLMRRLANTALGKAFDIGRRTREPEEGTGGES